MYVILFLTPLAILISKSEIVVEFCDKLPYPLPLFMLTLIIIATMICSSVLAESWDRFFIPQIKKLCRILIDKK